MFFLLIDISLFAQVDRLFQGLPEVINYTPEGYKAGIQNWDIIQSESGFIYAANNQGLLEYDGKNWIRYGVRDTKVRSIIQGSDGRIYVGSQADFGYMSPDEVGNLFYTSLADSLPESIRDFDETWKIFELNDRIYFCTFRGIYEYDHKSLNFIDPEDRLDISFLVNNELYAFSYENGLMRLDKDELKPIRNGEFFVNKRISNILPFDQNRLLITTFEHGAYLYDGEVEEFVFKGEFSEDTFLINFSLRLANGDIALATQNAGLFIINTNGELLLHLDKSSGLTDLTINYVYEDGQRNLWLATNNGLSRVELYSPFTFIDDRMGLSGSGYSALKDGDKLYLGTNIGLYIFEKGKLEFVEGTEGQVYSIQNIRGNILLGHQNGSFQINANKVRQISNDPGTWIFREVPNRPDLILQGNYTGLGILEINGAEVDFRNKLLGFEESSRLIEIDGKNVWIAHGYKGIFKVQLNEEFTEVVSSKLYNSDDGFSRDVLVNVFRVSNELIFTAEGGFFDYDESIDEFVPTDSFKDFFESGVTMVDMESDIMGNIFFIERNELGVLQNDPVTGFKLRSEVFNKVKSQWNDDLANVMVIDEKNILFGGKKGFIHYSPQSDIPRDNEVEVLFKSIVNQGDSEFTLFSGHDFKDSLFEESNNQVFPFSQNSMSFEFISPHFESGEEVLYQYKLEGYDEEWSDWSYENKKEYTNLRENDYDFKVRAKNIFEEISPDLSFRFKITPPFYRTIWAYLFYFFGTLITLFLAYKILDKRYTSKTRLLEKEQDIALKKKEEEIETITQRSNEEILRLKTEKLESEIEYKNQELTSSAMNLIQKNQLLSTVKNTLKQISKEEKSKSLNTQLSKLVKSIDKDLEGGSEWTQFSENFDQVHGNFITRLKDKYPKLTPQEIRFSAYIRMNLSTKEIANLLGISVRGVEIGRYRVRKKLGLERKDNLSDFLLRF